MRKSILKITFVLITGSLSSLLYGQNWESIGNGTGMYPRCIFADTTNDLIYVGGEFAFADTVRVNSIAAWNGTTWLPLGSGDTTCYTGCLWSILSIDKLGSDIYASGFFPNMGGVPNTKFMARWNGSNWNSIGEGTSQQKLKTLSTKLYVLGGYTTIAGISANGMATWDGSSWSDVYAFPNNTGDGIGMHTVEQFQGNLYAGGGFDNLGGMKGITMWNGSNWVALGSGILGTVAVVHHLVTFNNELYVGGAFFQSSGNVDDYIMVWNGSNWREFSPNVDYDGPILDMKIINNELHIVGAFKFIGDTTYYGIAKYDGNIFCAYGGANNFPTNIAGLNNELYFLTADPVIGTDTVNFVAKWTGTQMDSCITVLAGITDYEPKNNLIIYPNPAHSSITVEFDVQSKKNILLEIKNILGQTVKSIDNKIFTNGKNTIEIDFTKFSSGVYFIQLQSKNKIITKKIIKE